LHEGVCGDRGMCGASGAVGSAYGPCMCVYSGTCVVCVVKCGVVGGVLCVCVCNHVCVCVKWELRWHVGMGQKVGQEG